MAGASCQPLPLMALLLLGAIPEPPLSVLGLMPRAIYPGLFFIVYWGSIGGNETVIKISYLLREPHFRQVVNTIDKRGVGRRRLRQRMVR